jgi:thiamine biosynthesis lipoprotein
MAHGVGAGGSGPPPARSGARLLALGAGLAAIVVLGTLLPAGPQRATFRTFDGEAMSTLWRIVLPDRPGAGTAAEECFELFRRLDLELSEWKPGSPLAAVNRSAGGAAVPVTPDLFAVLERSLAMAEATEGAFDPSWAALWPLWDFRNPNAAPPDPAEIEAHRRWVDWRAVELDAAARTVRLSRAGMKLGLGAIGKGWALDRAAERLEASGFHDFLITAGGQVLARGRNGDRAWRVGVRDPRGARDELFAVVELSDGSLSTSADNESFFLHRGERYHHVLDPRTGWPARGARSATVLHSEAATADALSTALMVLGAPRGLELIEKAGGEGLVVAPDGELVATPSLERRLLERRPPRRG